MGYNGIIASSRRKGPVVGTVVFGGTPSRTTVGTTYFSITVTGGNAKLRFTVFGGACGACYTNAVLQSLSGSPAIGPITLNATSYQTLTSDICLPPGYWGTVTIQITAVNGTSGNIAKLEEVPGGC